MRRKIGQRNGRAGLLRELMRAALLCLLLMPLSQPAFATVSVSAANEGAGKRVSFHWPSAAQGNVSIDGRTLTITFSQPFDGSLDKVADALGGIGTFVRLSSDQKTLRVNLLKDMQVASDGSGNDVVLHLTPGGAAKPPAAPAPDKAQAGAVNLGDSGAPAPSAPLVDQPELTVSQGADYTRLRFEFPTKTSYTASLAEGQLTLAFKTDKPVRISELRVDPPPRIRDATGSLAQDTFTATIGVTPGVTLRQSTEANMIVIDLVDPPQTASAVDANPPTDDKKTDSKPAEANGTAISPSPAGNAAPANVQSAAPVIVSGTPAAVQAPPAAKPPQPSGQTGATAPAPDTVESVLKVKDVDVSMLDARLKDPNAGNPPPATDATENAADSSAAPADMAQAPAPPVKFAVAVTYGNDANRVRFPWGGTVPAAVLRRGERLWIAFGANGDIDLSPLDSLREKGVLSYGIFPADGATVVGMQLDDHILATVIPDSTGWTIALGDTILATAPDILLNARLDGDNAEIDAAMSGDLKTASFKDADVEDELVFVMSGPQAQGLVGTRRFVDFEALASAQGLVLRPISDGLTVRTAPGFVMIGKPGGLALSGTHMPGSPVALLPKRAKASPAEMKFGEWRGPKNISFNDGQKKRLERVALSGKTDHIPAQFDLVHYLFANELPQEALGELEVMASETPQIESDLHYRALRGVANLMAHRLDDAAKDLDDRSLPSDANSDLWRGMLAAAQHDWSKARVLFARSGNAIDKLDAPWQARARIAAAEAALGVNDVTNARMNLEFLPRDGLSVEDAGAAALLDARLDEALGQYDKAAAIYDKLADHAAEPIAVKARLAGTRLAARRGKITPDEAIDRLESLRFQWRGDEIEADTLKTLGQLYAQLGDYRHALTTMKVAVKHFPGTPTEREITDEMYKMFEDLYLGGKADQMPPIQALALYYDFKELTPIGPKGDIMIRRLSDRLVAMDLLDQASELLSYQVDNRLEGVARAQVAARLALVQLMNHKAEDALRTISGTRQARLPDTIAAQRRLIEARALMDLKRYDDALDVISDDLGPAIDRLRADIFWHQDDWAKAGPALESGLGNAWALAPALSEGQRFDVMRASIAYVLGGDKPSLARMAEEFGPKMKATPDEHAFQVVVSDPGNANLELHSLTEKFASIDTLSEFLDDLKKEDATDLGPAPAGQAASANPPTN